MNRKLLSFLKTIALVVMPFVIACGKPVVPAGADYETPSSSDFSKLRKDILKLINEHREEKGLPALKPDDDIESVADRHSSNMASGRTGFGHDGFEARNKELGKRMGGVRAMAENVAFGKLSAERVVDLWLGSSGHRKNIEGDYKFTGIGLSKDKKGQIYFTQIFILK